MPVLDSSLRVLVSLAALVEAPASNEASAPPASEKGSEDPAETEAKAAVAEGLRAAARGDCATAVTHFERALELRPAAGIHYNIGVCHHRAMMQAEPNSAEHDEARRAAIVAYNRYLEAAPEAPDRDEVERTVLALGGRPASLAARWRVDEVEAAPDETDPLPMRDDAGEDTALEDPSVSEVDTAAGPEFGPTPPLPDQRDGARARLGFGFVFGIVDMERLVDTDAVRTLPIVGGVIRIDGFLGPAKRLALGGDVVVYGQTATSRDAHVLTGGWADLGLMYEHRVGAAKRLELGGGGFLGLGVQTLRHYGETTVTCPVSGGSRVSRRGSLRVGARFGANLLLGAKRRHELFFRLTPALALRNDGDRGTDTMACEDEGPNPWAEVGLDSGPALVLTFDVGYAPRL